MARLIFTGTKFGGRIYEFTREKTTVGRGDQNTLAIHDPSVSQTHCEVLVYGSEVIVRDLGSSNGTFLNGERLHNQQRPVRSGQIVKFGSVEALLEMEAPRPDDTATAETAIFAHVRYMREQQHESKKPAVPSATFDSGPAANPADHTILLPQPPEASEAHEPEELRQAPNSRRPVNKITLALIFSAVVVGLTIIVLLIQRM